LQKFISIDVVRSNYDQNWHPIWPVKQSVPFPQFPAQFRRTKINLATIRPATASTAVAVASCERVRGPSDRS
jgi:hypothetical protein